MKGLEKMEIIKTSVLANEEMQMIQPFDHVPDPGQGGNWGGPDTRCPGCGSFTPFGCTC